MHIFVSYSRRDGELVGRIVDRIESSGHEVWIDTDDIVGSDRWRSSVAEAITTADVVVLMVSPASMASPSVEREITVAAEEDRRILPVEIEPAEVAIGLQYDLAGIQRISFVDRPFDEGVADLLTAITDSPASSARRRSPPSARTVPNAPTGPSMPIGPRRAAGRRPRTVVVWVLAAAVVAGLAAVGSRVRSDDDTPADPTPGTTRREESGDADATGAGTTAPVRLADVALDSTVWFAGYTIHVSRARMDVAEGTISVDVQFTNDQDDTGSPCPYLLEDIALVIGGHREILWADRCPPLSPGTSTRSTLDATLPSDAVAALDLGDAVVELGGPEQHRATIPLDGRPATSEFPTQHAVTGTLTGEVTSFVVERVDVVPADCSSSTPMAYPPGRSDQKAIIVTGTATSSYQYPLNYGKARLTLSDGTDVTSNNLNGAWYGLAPGVPEHDVRACFVVPLPIGGEYRFTAAAVGDEPFPEPITFTL